MKRRNQEARRRIGGDEERSEKGKEERVLEKNGKAFNCQMHDLVMP